MNNTTTVTVHSITLVNAGEGPDTLYLETNLPEGVFPFSAGRQSLMMQVARDHALVYAQTNFPNVPLEDLRTRK